MMQCDCAAGVCSRVKPVSISLQMRLRVMWYWPKKMPGGGRSVKNRENYFSPQCVSPPIFNYTLYSEMFLM